MNNRKACPQNYFAPPYVQYKRSNFDQMMNRNWIPQCVVESYNSNDDGPSCDELDPTLPSYVSGKLDLVNPSDPKAQAILKTWGVVGSPKKGGMCKGKVTVYKVKEGDNIQMTRGFGSGGYPFSNWWNFGPPPPHESAADYMKKDEMCSQVTHTNTCELKAGQLIAVGPGESMKCGDTIYPRAASNPLQVYVPNGREQTNFICHQDHIAQFPPPSK